MSPFSFCCWPIVVSNLAGPPPSRLSIGPSDPPAGNHANARARPRLSPPRRPPAALCTLWWESFRCSMEIRTTGKLVKSGLDEFDGRGGGRLWREEVRACPWARHRLTSPTSRTHDTSERCCSSYMLQITMDYRFCKKKSIDPSVTPMPGCSRNSNKPKPWSTFLKRVSTCCPSSFGGIKFIAPRPPGFSTRPTCEWKSGVRNWAGTPSSPANTST